MDSTFLAQIGAGVNCDRPAAAPSPPGTATPLETNEVRVRKEEHERTRLQRSPKTRDEPGLTKMVSFPENRYGLSAGHVTGKNVYPVLFEIRVPFSDVRILIYSVFFSITLSLLLAIVLGTRAVQNRDLSVDVALNMTLFGLIGLILGARVYAICENPSFYFSHPLRAIQLWEGSLATYGGAIGGVLGCATYLWLKKQPVFDFLDVYAPYGFLGLGIIRVGDFLNGTAFGKRADLPWAVRFPKDSFAYKYHLQRGWLESGADASLPVHPTQLYEALVSLFLCGVLLFWFRFPKRTPSGAIFLAGSLGYAVLRFAIDLLRQDLDTRLPLGLASTQWVGLGVAMVSACALIHRCRLANRGSLQER